MAEHQHEDWQLRESPDGGRYCAACGAKVRTEPTEADLDRAEEILGTEDGYEPTKWAIAQALTDEREKAEEGGVHDFLQWLAAQNGGFGIALVTFTPGFVVDGIEEEHQPGQLLERWKAERNG